MIDANLDIYELFELFGHVVLFTCARVDRDTIPTGLYAYDLRDDCDGVPYEVSPVIIVNHFGTVICKEPIEFNGNDYRLIAEDEYDFLGGDCTLEKFLSIPPENPVE